MRSVALVRTDSDLGAEIRAAHEAAYGATYQALLHARRAGDLLLLAKSQISHGEWLPWLAAHCPTISERTVAYNSGDHEWYSPADYVEPARQVLGEIDLDPMSSVTANEVVQAATFYDIETDGLKQPWHGRVWLNPPYKNATMNAVAAKLIEHYERGEVEAAILLSNNASDTSWFHALMAEAAGVCFPRGRAEYWRGDTREHSSALQGQAIFYFGHRFDRFSGVFGEVGLVLVAMQRATAVAARRELVGW